MNINLINSESNNMGQSLDSIKQRIEKACSKVGRDPKEITLVAVSKTQPCQAILDGLDLELREFGENRVQEFERKYDELSDLNINWHFIGHLQRNKVKNLIGKASLIHSVDSLRLAKKISEESKKQDIITDILIQVNIANEDTKFGVDEEELLNFIDEINDLAYINVRGLMAMAPFVDDSEENRVHFKDLNDLYIDIKEKNIDNVNIGKNSYDILSMGMSNDFDVAIEEGATMVRIGTSLFGNRQYN